MISILNEWINPENITLAGNGLRMTPVLFSLHLVAGTLIGLSCYSAAIAYFAHRRQRRLSGWMPMLSVLAILACGTAHLWYAWHGGTDPDHILQLTATMLTALAAAGAAILFWHLPSRASREPAHALEQLQRTVRQLEHEVAERKRAEEELQKSRELLRQLAAYQEQIKEDERKRIAREIHDELGQNLMALRIDVSILHARTRISHPLLHEKVRFVLGHIDTSIKAVRAIINNLRPSVLDLGLHAAIEWQVDDFERRSGIACKLSTDESKPGHGLNDQHATALFRILQESLTNVARHAQASLVTVELHGDGESLLMKIADNGVGIFSGCRRKPDSFGLIGIEERVSNLGGKFVIDSVPGQGTVLAVWIPVRPEFARS